MARPAAGTLGLILPTLPQRRPLPEGPELARVARQAAADGAAALWACDHLFWHGPVLECFGAMTLAATAAPEPLVGSCVLQLPLRRTAVVAKQATTVQHLSGGRLVLGVGVGSHEGEYEAAGADFHHRGRLLDEGIDELRRLWAHEPGPDGRWDGTDPATRYGQRPVPAPIPVWVGGSSEAALRRAARRADGWIPLFLGPDEYAAAMDRLDKEAERGGRRPGDVCRAITVFVSVGDERTAAQGCEWLGSLYALPPKAFARHLVAGDAETCAAALARWVAAGAEHVAVYMAGDDPLVTFGDLSAAFAGTVAAGTGRVDG